MSSGTHADVASASKMLEGGVAAKTLDEGANGTSTVSERQLHLERLWKYYRCDQYSSRATDWDGGARVGQVERESVVQGQFIPPGFYDAGQTMPLKFRHPSVPYHLPKVIVQRFTGLLFSAKRHPQIKCDDKLTQEWLIGVAKATRLWSRMTLARNLGGAMGSVAIGFKFNDGYPKLEVHDPRWSFPTFSDHDELTIERFEKRFLFQQELRGPDGKWYKGWFWHRRLIDTHCDIVWPAVPQEDDEEPNWAEAKYVKVEHGLGFCPVVWVQNNEVQDQLDGDSDCHGAYDMIEAVDQLLSQAHRGALANSDPTVVIVSDADFDPIKKGSDNAIQVEKGGSANYMEVTGSGPKSALDMADDLEQRVLRTVRCTLEDNFDGPARTEEEVEANYSAMTEQADLLREQYGERGVLRLLNMILTAARQLTLTRIERGESGAAVVRGKIRLPKNEDGTERQMGKGEVIELAWPPYRDPSPDQVGKAVTAAGQAKQFGLIDDEHATQYVASFFQIENVELVVARAKKAQEEMASAFVDEARSKIGGENATPPMKMPAGMR